MFVINIMMYWWLIMSLKNIATLNVKGIDFRWILCGISRDGAVNRVNKSVLEDKDVL